MHKQFFPAILVVLLISFVTVSCRWRTAKGNGNITTESRNEVGFKSVTAAGSFDVYFSQDAETEVKITSDENLMKFIITEVENGVLKIKTRQGINLRPTEDIKVYVKAPQYADLALTGSGNMEAQTKISSTDRVKFSISGSGDIKVPNIDAPKVEVHIAGSGKVEAAGLTKDAEIHVAGSGDVDTQNMKAENAEIHIAGSGNVWVYASMKLDVHVAGGGDIHYFGNPADIKSKMAGSGNLIKEK